MRTRVLLAIAAALILVVGMTAIASNMGFKISIPLTAGYTNFVSLPYYNNFANANELYSDIAGCTEVSRWDNATALWDSYIGARGTGFTLNEAEALTVKVSGTIDWICVGSHDPTYGLTLTTGYTNFVSVPYHTTCANANELYTEIANCTEVSRWDNGTALWDSYIGARGTGFTLTPGEGLTVKVAATNTWTPSHY